MISASNLSINITTNRTIIMWIYMIEEFEVSGFNNNKNLSYDKNVISRMRNNLIGAMKDQPVLPKFIVIVLDDDVITYFKNRLKKKEKVKNEDMKAGYERMLRWLMCQYKQSISSQKEYLPKKAKKPQNDPKFIWIALPTHKNFRNNELREIFSDSLETVTSHFHNNYTLKLIKIWDPNDPSLILEGEKNLTSTGFKSYWNAVDKAIKYADTLLLKKEAAKNEKNKSNGNQRPAQSHMPSHGHSSMRRSQEHHRTRRDDRYHWHRKPRRH